MALKPQDILICLALACRADAKWTYAELAESIGLSASEAKKGVDRALSAALLAPNLEADQKPIPIRRALADFLIHGARHAFFTQPGRIVRGIPTAWAAEPLVDKIISSDPLPPVWPFKAGSHQGQAVEPLYRSVPDVAPQNPKLYELLALVDALRIGRVRERALAAKLLTARLLDAAPESDDAA